MTIQRPIKLWNKNFILLWQGTLFSTFGDVLYSICIGYWVYEQTGSTALMGLLSSISMFVTMVLGPLCGAIIDRSQRRWIIVGADFIRGVMMIVLGLFALDQHMEVWMVLTTALVAALCNAFFSPCSMTVLSDLVAPGDLVRAQSLFNGSRSLFSIFGKGLSGAIIAFCGVPLVILLNGISLLISAFTEIFITVPPAPKTGMPIQWQALLDDLKEGARFVFSDSCLRLIAIIALAANFFGSGMSSVMLPFCLSRHLDLTQYGLLLSIQSIAALAGTFLIGLIRLKPEIRTAIMIAAFPLSSLLSAIFYAMTHFFSLALFFLLFGFCNAIANAILNASMMLVIPRSQRATITGFITTASCGGQAFSSLIFGFLAEFIDLGLLGILSSLISILPFALLRIYPQIRQRFIQAELNPQT